MKDAREILAAALDRHGHPHAADLVRITEESQLVRVGPILGAALAAVKDALEPKAVAHDEDKRFFVMRTDPSVIGGVSYAIEHGDQSRNYSAESRKAIVGRMELPADFKGSLRDAHAFYQNAVQAKLEEMNRG